LRFDFTAPKDLKVTRNGCRLLLLLSFARMGLYKLRPGPSTQVSLQVVSGDKSSEMFIRTNWRAIKTLFSGVVLISVLWKGCISVV